MNYQNEVEEELEAWERTIKRKSSMISRSAKRIQSRMNELIPERVHSIVTASIKTMVQGVLVGNTYTVHPPKSNQALKVRDQQAKDLIRKYKRIAATEGAGTGAGGILLGLADFPLLLSIKMKFLFDLASIYGFDAKKLEERIFILTVFQLAFSSDAIRKESYDKIVHWEENLKEAPRMLEAHDWKAFQLEYRDYIDLPKLLQMIPGIGAIVGAYVNYHFLDWLGQNAMNAYRIRSIKKEDEHK
ncbi:EcsC family protein [Bacillus sp. RAR_GA_16]|uniref:EcsC family protein n=1 Tax=Bacillus sp. RAR_GA_16 TaxID=2876774 RepID=UPI001CCDCD94|nr:EcsC family protein [Bacillus sp. RAR_GA_16]MCA0173455.1 EcsC family protein [Bacillus sp. RAR_GA_16]